MRYFILKGFKYSWPKLFGRHKSLKPVYWTVKFNKRCWYQIGSNPDEKDINKLCGVSFGTYKEAHHHYSVRIGWLPDEQPDKIRLFLYSYNGGIRTIKDLNLVVRTGREFDIRFYFNAKRKEVTGSVDHVLFNLDMPVIDRNGYYLGFYHGGNLPAKQFMYCDISRD